jgi:hypothetical protein
MFPARRAAVTALAACGLLAAPAAAQLEPPTSGIGQALRASVSTVSAPPAPRLTRGAASALLDRTLRTDGYSTLGITDCRHSSARVVRCAIDVMLDDAHFKGSGSVRLLHNGARVRYTVLGVG